jgi:8-oxo-dGTP pyrophosphatase MutT (NUDIX family)
MTEDIPFAFRPAYTLSIAMTKSGKFVFVQKDHGPMSGKSIFVGGKVEENEGAYEANAREFKEELGYTTSESDWFPIATIRYPSYTLHVFLLSGITLRESLIPQKTDVGEKIFLWNGTDENEDYPIDGLCKMLIQEVVLKI